MNHNKPEAPQLPPIEGTAYGTIRHIQQREEELLSALTALAESQGEVERLKKLIGKAASYISHVGRETYGDCLLAELEAELTTLRTLLRSYQPKEKGLEKVVRLEVSE